MNDFFRSKTFKIIAVLLAAVLAFFLRAVYTGGLMPALSHIGGAVATPAGEFFAGIGNAIEDFFQPIFHGRELQQENEALQKQVAAKFSNLDVNLINGGQPVYYYIISVE